MKYIFYILTIPFFFVFCKNNVKCSSNKSIKSTIKNSSLMSVAQDSAIINGNMYYSSFIDILFFIYNQRNEIVFRMQDFCSTCPQWIEFTDFNKDGFKDLYIGYGYNVPGYCEVALFDEYSNKFNLVENLEGCLNPVKINNIDFYYSYNGTGCADINWESYLFFIDKNKATRIGHIKGIGCEDADKTGIFITKIKNNQLIKPMKEIIKKPGYDHDKIEFIEKYWTNNYELFR